MWESGDERSSQQQPVCRPDEVDEGMSDGGVEERIRAEPGVHCARGSGTRTRRQFAPLSRAPEAASVAGHHGIDTRTDGVCAWQVEEQQQGPGQRKSAEYLLEGEISSKDRALLRHCEHGVIYKSAPASIGNRLAISSDACESYGCTMLRRSNH